MKDPRPMKHTLAAPAVILSAGCTIESDEDPRIYRPGCVCKSKR